MERIWFLVSFWGLMVNFLLVIGTNQLCGHTPSWGKAMLAGLLGGLHAGVCLVKGFSFLGQMHWRMIFLLLIAATSFGWSLSGLRRGALFILLHLAIGKLAMGEIWPFLLAVAAICLLCSTGVNNNANQGRFAEVTITRGDETIRLKALMDTGNSLRDPVSGRRVLVVSDEIAWRLLHLDKRALSCPLETFSSHFIPGLRLIPYQSVGQSSGFLLGVRVDELRIDGDVVDQIVAFAPQTIGQENTFQALAGGVV